MSRAGSIREPALVHFLLVAVAAGLVGLFIWLVTRDAKAPSPEEARIIAEQRARLDAEQHVRGLVEVQPSR